MRINVLIVDDEALARQGIRDFLEDVPDVQVVGECADGLQAVQAIQESRPDLVFLDVQMPELDGFDVLRAVGSDRMPPVIFVTAHDRYAIEAFDVHAVDYLLKPVERERFLAALQRARRQLDFDAGIEMGHRVAALLRHLHPRRPARRLAVKQEGRTYFVEAPDIDWIEAAGNYARIHVGDQHHLIRETMASLADRLGDDFVRIHRSTIVNLDRIAEIRPWFKGDYLVVLEDRTELSLTRTYRDVLEERIGGRI